MIEQQIIDEGNKIIARYHGARYNEETNRLFYDTDAMSDFAYNMISSDYEDVIPLKYARYHSSWDWIMAIVSKIATDLGSSIFHAINYLLSRMDKQHGEGIEFLWGAVVDYLKFRNV